MAGKAGKISIGPFKHKVELNPEVTWQSSRHPWIGTRLAAHFLDEIPLFPRGAEIVASLFSAPNASSLRFAGPQFAETTWAVRLCLSEPRVFAQMPCRAENVTYQMLVP